MAKIYDKKINKKTDWGGDESTGNLPVSGRSVQEFIKEQLNSKVGVFHYDTTNNRYIVFADEECQDAYFADPTKTELILGAFDAPFNYSAQITLSSPTYVAILSGTKNNYIDFTFDTRNKSGQSVGEDVICTYTIIKGGVKKTVTEKYRYGQAAHFNIDEYLSTGTNTITVGIVGQTTLAATTIGITYQVVDLRLSDTYDISQSYNIAGNPGSTAAIPYSVSGYGTKIMEWYLDGVLLDYVKVEDEIVDVSTTRTKYISLANLSQGIHSLQYRAYTMLDGERFYSNTLYRDLMVVTGVDKHPIIAVAATIPVGYDILKEGILQLFGIIQYVPYDLNFAVYNPSGAASTQAVISMDDKIESTVSARNGEVVTYSIRPAEYGIKVMTVTADTTIYPIGLNITKSSTSLEQVTDGLQLDMTALGKSNNDVNKEEWGYGIYQARFNGFKWNKASGWNDNRLLITSGAYVDVNLAPLSPDPTVTGKTLEFEFATANVSDDNAVICDLRNSAGTGLLITASGVILKSAGGAEVSTKFKSGDNIRVAFVINRKTGVANKGLAHIYVDGVLSGTVNYSSTDNFTSDRTLRIGNTTLADVQLKALRFYNAALSSDQILNNHILYRDTTEELLSIYDRNNIYEEGTQNFSVDKLSAQCPVFIFTGDIPALENTTDKNKTIYVDVECINMQDPSKSFIGKGIRLRPQGTSSMGYPKKNLRPYLGYGEVWDNLGKIMKDGLYAFKEGAQPVNVFCLKADYAESSGTHNTGIGRLWNQVMTNAQLNGEYVLRTGAQKAAIAAGYPYDVRTTVDGFPCNVFYRLTADSELVYMGKYNFNNDKSTESVFGFRDIPGFDNSRMQCWEVLNNGNHLALFQDTENFDTEWDQAFEARYPDGSTRTADLKAFCEWVVSTKDDPEKFRAGKWEHLDVYKVAAYYVYLMRFGAVDQVVKNAMLTSEDGQRFFYINYDNDTIIGVRNDGRLAYGYDIDRQTVDDSFSALVYAYAGHDSTLWNNLEADEEFMQTVSEIDNALYMAGLSYEKVIDMFDNRQAGKWCERIYNQDAQYKYIGPYTDSGINNLFMLQGSRTAHRRWWLSHRFDLYDSKFVSGAYKAKSVEFKAANAPAGLQFSITSGNRISYGYGLNNVVVEKGVDLGAGESHTFTTRQVINVGDPVRVYSAVNIQELDVHDFIEYLSTINVAEVYNESVGTKFKKLVMGVDTSKDSRRNTSLSMISGLSQARRLEYLDISGYRNITTLDLSGHIYLSVLKAYESGLTSLILANGSPVTTLELPDSMQALHFDSLPDLGSGFNILNAGRHVNSIFIRNCPRLNTKDFVFQWNANRVTESFSCSLILEGINWSAVNADDLMALGSIKDAGGTLSLKGTVSLVSVTQEQLMRIKEIFGNGCTTPGNELYVKAPDGVFVTGPSEILEGGSAQYNASVFSENPGMVEYYIWNGYNEVASSNGATINKETGLVTTSITGSNRSITVRAKHIPTQGAVVRGEMQVTINRIVYPSSVAISGSQFLNTVGTSRYDLVIKTSQVSGEYQTTWSLSGDAFEQGLVAVGVQDKDYCVLNVLSTPSELVTFELKATVRKGHDSSVAATKTLSIELFIPGVIMTKKSNPKVLELCYNAGWCASQEYMTELEAKMVSDLGKVFYYKNIETFDELRYFIGINSIPDECFNACQSLMSITLPPTIERIGYMAFSSTKIKSINIPDGVTSIDRRAFYYCDELIDISIPDSVTNIGPNSVFENCFKLESVKLPNTMTSLGRGFFRDCRALASLDLPDGITTIESQAFYGCRSLKEITLPGKLIKLDINAFSDNLLLENIYIPENNLYFQSIDGVLYSKDKSKIIKFPKARNMENYTIATETVVLGERAFYNCKNLVSVVIPENVTHINSYCFSGCASLKQVNIPPLITEIADSTFSSCNLEEVVLHENITSLGSYAFSWNKNLKSVEIKSDILSINEWAFGNCTKLEHINIPDSVTSIKYSAFYKCEVLSEINIPSSVASIGNQVFSNCVGLRTIIMHSPTAPDVSDTAFGSDTTNNAYTGRNTYDQGINILYVPAGATGYDTGVWADVLLNPEKCGFTISYTL